MSKIVIEYSSSGWRRREVLALLRQRLTRQRFDELAVAVVRGWASKVGFRHTMAQYGVTLCYTSPMRNPSQYVSLGEGKYRVVEKGD